MISHTMDSERLHKQLKSDAGLNKIPLGDRFELMRFTDHSKRTGEALSNRLNKSLASGDKIHPLDKGMHDAILRYASPASTGYDVYSGTRFDAKERFKPNEETTTPTHISASHDMNIGLDHADKRRPSSGIAHMNHIKISPGNKVLYVGEVSKHPAEYETIIPVGSSLKYVETTHHVDEQGRPIDMHHFELK